MNPKMASISLSLLALLTVAAAQLRAQNSPSTKPAAADIDPDSYQGAPVGDEKINVRLIGAGARGPESSTISIYVWCPEEIGATVRANPPLIWRLNEATDRKVKVTVSDPARHKSWRIWSSTGTVSAGIHVLDTAANGFTLEENVVYKWTVSVINDETDPSKDLYSTGYIRRIPASTPDAATHTFYDAIDSAVTGLEKATAAGDAANLDGRKARLEGLLKKVKLDMPSSPTITHDSAGA
jgi:hypothetical protein